MPPCTFHRSGVTAFHLDRIYPPPNFVGCLLKASHLVTTSDHSAFLVAFRGPLSGQSLFQLQLLNPTGNLIHLFWQMRVFFLLSPCNGLALKRSGIWQYWLQTDGRWRLCLSSGPFVSLFLSVWAHRLRDTSLVCN